MDKEIKKYMTSGKEVTCNGTKYILIEDMKEDGKTVKAVKKDKINRFRMLRAWSGNHVGLKEGERVEFENLPEELPTDKCIPCNMIRFINSRYDTLFEVRDFSHVFVGDKVYMAVYIDDYHIYLLNPNGYARCFHICEFAEYRERNGLGCEPDDWEHIQEGFEDIFSEDKTISTLHERAVSLIVRDAEIPYEKARILWTFLYDEYDNYAHLFDRVEDYTRLLYDMTH